MAAPNRPSPRNARHPRISRASEPVGDWIWVNPRMAMGTAALTAARGWPLRCASPSSGAYPIKPITLAPRIKPCAITTRSAPASSPTLISKRNSAARKTKVKSASAKSALILVLLRFKNGPLGGRNNRALDCRPGRYGRVFGRRRPPSVIARLSPFALADAPHVNLCPGVRISSRNMVLQKHPLRQGGSHAKANP